MTVLGSLLAMALMNCVWPREKRFPYNDLIGWQLSILGTTTPSSWDGNVPRREALVYVAAAIELFGVHGSRFRYAFVTFMADQLLTNSPSRSRASVNLSVIAAKPRRK